MFRNTAMIAVLIYLVGLQNHSYANPLIVAHRGASNNAPENTIPGSTGGGGFEDAVFQVMKERILLVWLNYFSA